MRTLLLISTVTVVTVQAGEPGVPTMRQKVHARIMESAPPPPPPKSSPDEKDEEKPAPPVVMKPVVVSESKVVREVTAALERQKQERLEERFSPLQGGKIATIGPMQLGGWWSLDEGWSFLRLNKGRTQRQADAAEARLEELQELADLAEGAKPASGPNVTKFPWWRRTSSDK